MRKYQLDYIVINLLAKIARRLLLSVADRSEWNEIYCVKFCDWSILMSFHIETKSHSPHTWCVYGCTYDNIQHIEMTMCFFFASQRFIASAHISCITHNNIVLWWLEQKRYLIDMKCACCAQFVRILNKLAASHIMMRHRDILSACHCNGWHFNRIATDDSPNGEKGNCHIWIGKMVGPFTHRSNTFINMSSIGMMSGTI